MGMIGILMVFFASIVAFFSKPRQALAIYIAVLLYYPLNLRLIIGTIDFTADQIVLLAVLINIFFRTQLISKFKWNKLDFFVCAVFLGQCIALTTTTDIKKVIIRQGCILFQTLFVYFATRFIATSKEEFISLIKQIILIAVPLAILGTYECITGKNLYQQTIVSHGLLSRLGFYRAQVKFITAILFGLFFAGLAPICLGLLKYQGIKKIWILTGCGFMILGILSSMSSAPLFSVVTSGLIVFIYPYRKYMRVFLVLFLFCCLFVEIYSNRHFYQVGTRFALNTQSANYRMRLWEEALGGGMDGHWLTGYGYVGIYPGADNSNFNWKHKDLVNIYIAILCRFGLIGLIPFMITNILYYKRLYDAFVVTTSEADRWNIWCFTATLVGWNMAMMTVNIFGIINVIFYLLIALSCNFSIIISKDHGTSKKAFETIILPKESF